MAIYKFPIMITMLQSNATAAMLVTIWWKALEKLKNNCIIIIIIIFIQSKPVKDITYA